MVRGSCFSDEGGRGRVLLPAPPRPKPIALGYVGDGSWSVRVIVVVGRGGEGEGGGLAGVVGRVVLVMDLVGGLSLADCGAGEAFEDQGVAHGSVEWKSFVLNDFGLL